MGVIEETIGFILIFVVLLDVFLLILYARANKTIISTELSHVMWKIMVWISKPFGRWREVFLTLSGPFILVTVLGSWTILLSLATALIVHPNLGTGIISNNGQTPTDFITALYVGGSSLDFIGSSDFSPQNGFFRIFFLMTSIIGLTLTSLIVTYLLELYNNLRERNTLGLKVNLMSSETGDAAEVICHLGPQGQFENGYNNIVDWSAETARVKESHHFYPMLFFFRFREPYYSISRTALTSLDTISLIKSALDDKEYGWLKESAAVGDLWSATMQELQTIAKDLIPDENVNVPPEQRTVEQWRRRYEKAIERLKAAKIKTARDGVENYVSLRKQWDRYVTALAPKFGYEMEEIDPTLETVK